MILFEKYESFITKCNNDISNILFLKAGLKDWIINHSHSSDSIASVDINQNIGNIINSIDFVSLTQEH